MFIWKIIVHLSNKQTVIIKKIIMKNLTSIKENEIKFWSEKLANELKEGNEFEINQAEEMLEKLTK